MGAKFQEKIDEMQAAAQELKDAPVESSDADAQAAMRKREDQLQATASEFDAYESKVQSMMDRVRAETANVEREVETLQSLQKSIEDDPIIRLSNFGTQPLPKQALFAASLLAFVRGGGDALSVVTSGDPGTYALPAVAQLGFALAAIWAYAFL